MFEKHSVLSFILYYIEFTFKQKYTDYSTSNIVPEKTYSETYFNLPFIAYWQAFLDTYRSFWIDYTSNAFKALKKAHIDDVFENFQFISHMF